MKTFLMLLLIVGFCNGSLFHDIFFTAAKATRKMKEPDDPDGELQYLEEHEYVKGQRKWMEYFGVKLNIKKSLDEDENAYEYSITDRRPNRYDSNLIDLKEGSTKLIAKIWCSARRSEKAIQAISDLIQVQKNERLINWATLYGLKPTGQTQFVNIEFDHIPPGSANVFEATIKENDKTMKLITDMTDKKGKKKTKRIKKKGKKKNTKVVEEDTELIKYLKSINKDELLKNNAKERKSLSPFKNQAPTVAISNFDHRSVLWKKCSTGTGAKTMLDKYMDYANEGKHVCAIFANLYCFKYYEPKMSKYDRTSNEFAFIRYKEGFKSLVDLHYDFGYKYNVLLPEVSKTSSAYCQVDKTEKCSGKTTATADKKMYYYCPNLRGKFQTCYGRERNLRIDDYVYLKKWLNQGMEEEGRAYEEYFRGLCDLKGEKWTNLFELKKPKKLCGED